MCRERRFRLASSSQSASFIEIATRVRPDKVTLVPERREEVPTEGVLDVIAHQEAVAAAVQRLHIAGIYVSLFIDPCEKQIDAAARLGVEAVELHTGCYANASVGAEQADRLSDLAAAGEVVRSARLDLAAGHGLTYRNVVPVARLPGMGELNIGHSIVARSVIVGITQAVREMKALIT